MPPKIDQQVTFLYTTDLKRTSLFYSGILELEMVLDQGTCQIYRVAATGFLGICEKKKFHSDRDNVIFTLVTNSVDEWYSYLLEKEVDIEKPPTLNQKYNIYHLFLRDPEGYLIEIQKFIDPKWPI